MADEPARRDLLLALAGAALLTDGVHLASPLDPLRHLETIDPADFDPDEPPRLPERDFTTDLDPGVDEDSATESDDRRRGPDPPDDDSTEEGATDDEPRDEDSTEDETLDDERRTSSRGGGGSTTGSSDDSSDAELGVQGSVEVTGSPTNESKRSNGES